MKIKLTILTILSIFLTNPLLANENQQESIIQAETKSIYDYFSFFSDENGLSESTKNHLKEFGIEINQEVFSNKMKELQDKLPKADNIYNKLDNLNTDLITTMKEKLTQNNLNIELDSMKNSLQSYLIGDKELSEDINSMLLNYGKVEAEKSGLTFETEQDYINYAKEKMTNYINGFGVDDMLNLYSEQK